MKKVYKIIIFSVFFILIGVMKTYASDIDNGTLLQELNLTVGELMPRFFE